ncbi:sigma-70 family RNA polymerase sigma factor [Phytoactinopolyspora alkaliphila]|uniref:Sigma-70 family RNA polymerase sigma factor n=1 Tax=Phytoactinopolyspora alkaliphila TaxID=1783498 RepID=A0A6N9YHZ8_9ACTN|nr:sigma-70 family RNA polymerase sigma factor [Phytoactinopolyspora alkaliphila]NED94626.1 sigma-70 family RNA polymerase sigma factor [Phytoactinopolyspora alkaliphila]
MDKDRNLDQRTADAEAWLDSLDPETTPAEDISDLRAIAKAVNDAAAAERHVREAVEIARVNGRSWTRIGIALASRANRPTNVMAHTSTLERDAVVR